MPRMSAWTIAGLLATMVIAYIHTSLSRLADAVLERQR